MVYTVDLFFIKIMHSILEIVIKAITKSEICHIKAIGIIAPIRVVMAKITVKTVLDALLFDKKLSASIP